MRIRVVDGLLLAAVFFGGMIVFVDSFRFTGDGTLLCFWLDDSVGVGEDRFLLLLGNILFGFLVLFGLLVRSSSSELASESA